MSGARAGSEARRTNDQVRCSAWISGTSPTTNSEVPVSHVVGLRKQARQEQKSAIGAGSTRSVLAPFVNENPSMLWQASCAQVPLHEEET